MKKALNRRDNCFAFQRIRNTGGNSHVKSIDI